jgi:hypothetical protein
MNARPLRSASARGFTLVELMVALSGGLFLSMVVFALARDTNRFYQQQTRLANATLSGIVGFDRLRADIARAGYLSTPNLVDDPHVCSQPSTSWPARIQTLRSVRLQLNSSAPSTTLDDNDIFPMSMLLAGSFTSADEFPIRTVLSDGATTSIYLQVNTGPMARLGYDVSGVDGGDSSKQVELLGSVFRAGRILRILDRTGQQHYGVISAVTGGTEPFISLDSSAPLTFRSTTALTCGLKGLEVGATVNVVNVMKYEIRNLKTDANYAALFSEGVKGPYDDDRTDLVRTELSATGAELDGTTELLAEYAVDLQFAFTVFTSSKLVSVDREHELFDDYFPTDETLPTDVQHLRAVRARLAVRSREADRAENVDNSLTGLYRIGLGADGKAPYARVRNFQADIALHNHGRTEW